MAISPTTPPASTTAAGNASIIGAAVPRIDGPQKTTGTAMYASDHNLPGMLYAIPVGAGVAYGEIESIDTARAESMRGVVRVYTRANFPKVYRSNPADNDASLDERRPPFEDDTVRYSGQYIALVLAATMDQARAAAAAVRVTYRDAKPDVSPDLADGFTEKMKVVSTRGDIDEALTKGAVTLDHTYITPIEVHNPIEMHASVADWDGTRFTLYESTQAVMNHQAVCSQMLGVPPDHVTIVMKFLGSGFGGKLWPWPHTFLAAAASRDLRRPVKLVIDRHMMFTNVGHRPRTVQRIRLAATQDGILTGVSQDYTNDTSLAEQVGEDCGEATPYLYSAPSLRVRSSMVPRNLGTPTAMRGPGAVPGLYALESALDELAIQLKLDPVELRLRNEPANDESNGKPFASRHMAECLRVGAERFGWSRRTPAVGSMRQGDLILGWGVAAASWISMRMPCKASLALNDDGSAEIRCATQDIGTGTYTVFAQAVHAQTGIPLDRIRVVLGHSTLPPGPVSGGSWATGSVLPAISAATTAAIASLLTLATDGPKAAFAGAKPDDLALTDGRIHRRSDPATAGVPFEKIVTAGNLRFVSAEGSSTGSDEDPEAKKFSNHSYGAQFVEVEWDPGIARLRVSRVTSVIDVGQIINLKTARNQVEGAVVMGVGMGLFEESIYDQRTGHPVNNNLADYIVSTSADCPEIDVHFLDYPDKVANSYGARGVGEIGLAGVAPAITAAVYHATGVRVRELPVRIEDLLAASPKRPPIARA